MIENGKFIVLYGSNNLGKTEQSKRLVDSLNSMGIEAEYLKYPIYDLDPTGLMINEVLRGGNPLRLTPMDLQRVYAENRRDYQPVLEQTLKKGKWIVAEDYTGTGIAWGLTFGVSMEALIKFNKGLLNEDLAICLDGVRFSSGIERNHLHEGSEKWELNRAIHQELADKLGWEIVNANGTKEKIAGEVFKVVMNRFRL